MRKGIIILIVVLILLGFGFYLQRDADSEVPFDFDNEYIIGFIYDISGQQILVAEGIMSEEYTGELDDFVGNAGWFRVDQDTEIVGLADESLVFADLNVGVKVGVWVDGVVLESYPVQGTASKIQVLALNLVIRDKECHVGGCSGELCTDELDAMSTCEELPGAVCLKQASCELVEGECRWVLNLAAAECLMAIEDEGARESRIGYLFEEAERFLG